jgi:hypothetical protein
MDDCRLENNKINSTFAAYYKNGKLKWSKAKYIPFSRN